jgi:hypothetical protein
VVVKKRLNVLARYSLLELAAKELGRPGSKGDQIQYHGLKSGSAGGVIHPVAARRSSGMRANYLELTDGRRLCWAEYGDPEGQPIFLFHGNSGFPNAELQVLPGEGHLWILDHMPEVLTALLESRQECRDRSMSERVLVCCDEEAEP